MTRKSILFITLLLIYGIGWNIQILTSFATPIIPSPKQIREALWDLQSKNEKRKNQALDVLCFDHHATMSFLQENWKNLSTNLRLLILQHVPTIPFPTSGAFRIQITLEENHEGVRQLLLSLLPKLDRTPQESKFRLILEGILPNSSYHSRALDIIQRIDPIAFVGITFDFITSGKIVVSSSITQPMGPIHILSQDFLGYEKRWPLTQVVTSSKNTMIRTDSYRIPCYRVFEIQTPWQIPYFLLHQFFNRLTGVSPGYSLQHWRQWWQEECKKSHSSGNGDILSWE